jgi:hypothetical protein|nr:hypothetical protein [Aeromicrobium sp.]
MKSRIVWFVAGSAAGVYSAAKARRVAYRLSAPGVVDQASALGVGWRAFSAELRDGMQAREQQIVHRLTDASAPPALGLDEAPIDQTSLDQKAT